MRVNAYILAADPAWIEASLLSYYDYVERIVVSYDESGKSWTGNSINIGACIDRIKAIDRRNKCEFVAGHFARKEYFATPLLNDTYQRQCAYDHASQDADWVVQLDTDEILPDVDLFRECIERAERAAAVQLSYVMRTFWGHVCRDLYLERCRRGLRISGGSPGPMAIKPGLTLKLCRQTEGKHFRVDFPGGSYARESVDFPVKWRQAIWHMSWVRSEDQMHRKSVSSGHALEFDWSARLSDWKWSRRHPYLSTLRAFFVGGQRLVRLKGLLPSELDGMFV